MAINLSGHTILIIEDDPSIGHLLSALLKFEGADVFLVIGRKEALNFLNEKKDVFKPSVIITDNKMRGITGLEFLKNLKDKGIVIPTVMLTADIKKETREEALRLGVMQVFLKPFETTFPNDLKKLLEVKPAKQQTTQEEVSPLTIPIDEKD